MCFQEPGQICLPAGSSALPNWGPGTKKHRKTHRPSHSLPKALTAPLDWAGPGAFLRLPQPLDLSIRALVTRWGILFPGVLLGPCPWCPALKSLRPRSLLALAPMGHFSDHIILNLQDPTCLTGIHLHKLVCPLSWPRVGDTGRTVLRLGGLGVANRPSHSLHPAPRGHKGPDLGPVASFPAHALPAPARAGE